jgi:hypothetical protein
MAKRRSAAIAKSPGAVDLDPVLDFMRLLWRLEHGLQSASKQMEATLGITGPQRLVPARSPESFSGSYESVSFDASAIHKTVDASDCNLVPERNSLWLHHR